MGRDSTQYVEMLCRDCLVRVTGFTGERPVDCEVYIELVSPHTDAWDQRWRNRIKNAWRVLRGGTRCGFELAQPQDVDALIDALLDARLATWGAGYPVNPHLRPRRFTLTGDPTHSELTSRPTTPSSGEES